MQYPSKQGLYDPANEHDSCGVGFVANLKNQKSHAIIEQGLEILSNLTHRGAIGADPLAGDGAGLLIQLPDLFFRKQAERLGITLPEEGAYAVSMMFLPQDKKLRAICEKTLEKVVVKEGQVVLGWRDVPTDNQHLGESVRESEPVVRQLFIGMGKDTTDNAAFERKLFVIRKQAHHQIWDKNLKGNVRFYTVSMSSRIICFKGMILPRYLSSYYLDLQDPSLTSALAMVHQRFSTNTFPKWELAQPFRYLCHNGEINTIQGNINWMKARRNSMRSALLGEDLEKLWPLLGDGNSDSATFDNSLELLVANGYSLAHAMMIMIPESWHNNYLMDTHLRAFYEYHAAFSEPWDGPAFVAFTDGRQLGAKLDRNGLRPGRYIVTDDDRVIMASEVGVLDIPEHQIVEKSRLKPGKIFLVDLEKGQIIRDEDIKAQLSELYPFRKWLAETQIKLESLPIEVTPMASSATLLTIRRNAFGMTDEALAFFIKPMGLSGLDPVGSMGRDTPPAVLSERSKLLYDYFKQRFAEVTNPAIDPIRESLVMSMVSIIGPRPNLLDLNSGKDMKRLVVSRPVLSNVDLERIRHVHEKVNVSLNPITIDICYKPTAKHLMRDAITRICKQAEQAIHDDHNILILSDRAIDADKVAIPALLAIASVHHHLYRVGLRIAASLVIETGEACRVHDFCCLAGYGAEAINPYLALETLSSLQYDLIDSIDEAAIIEKYLQAATSGIQKVMSKMGISTFQSYCGAQVFDTVGLGRTLIDEYFTGTSCHLDGISLEDIEQDTIKRHHYAFAEPEYQLQDFPMGGDLSYHVHGEKHMWTPETIALFQHAVRSNDYEKFKQFTACIDEKSRKLANLRGLLEVRSDAEPIPLEEVEPVASIMQRFATGAMSFGSISEEAHTGIAVAMNRIGGRSNSGEGGEDPGRNKPLVNGDLQRSAIKQVASGRFGVTTEYLINADMIQIKIAQGAKPGEGGQLPGHKVDAIIAKVRNSTRGVGLISPPPHHDIYSIEDLSQLISDLKHVNPTAAISVKLVSEVGVGTIASGVTKGHADHILISGYEGGTGASPLTSILHAGLPWEIGLAETQQTLLMNRLRGRVRIQTDGGLLTARDVLIGAILGADEFCFGTVALVTQGCIMMRKCHLNTCPVGVATQDPKLRKRFTGDPAHLINYFTFLATELRELMAALGIRKINDLIGHPELLRIRDVPGHQKAQKLDLSALLYCPNIDDSVARHHCEAQDHGLEDTLDIQLSKQVEAALLEERTLQLETPIGNTDRSLGAKISGMIVSRYGPNALHDDTIHIKATGVAGQSFGAFLTQGVTLELVGDANDYVGKSLCGGRIIIYPASSSPCLPQHSIIAGNTLLYGAIRGECYISGTVGERFAVRNSGAVTVVEGVGDHGCEYMTGGVVLVLGNVGKNFAAGMSGGIAYVLAEHQDLNWWCNQGSVDLETIEREQAIDKAMSEAQLLNEPLAHDEHRLKMLIEKHYHYTNSGRAQEILNDWETYIHRFVKIVPKDFRAALQLRAKQHSAKRPLLKALSSEDKR